MRDATIVVPCFNEESRLDVGAVATCAAATTRLRFLFVDDGSRDATPEILARLSRELPDAITWMQLPVNSGKAEAVRQGMLAGWKDRPSYLGYWDADLATPLSMIARFLDELDADARLVGVLGCRVRRLGAVIERRAWRHYAGRIFATFASIVLQAPVYDTQCGAKLFRADETFAATLAEPFLSRWSFDVELLARLRVARAPQPLADFLMELPLERWEDVAGSKLTPARGLGAFLDLARIARKYRRPA